MRTTLDIDEKVLKAVKKRAIDERRPLRALVEDALRATLRPKAKPYKFNWKSRGGGLRPGVSFDDWHALRDRMDGVR
ncbi:MAG: hypothetical protein SFV18_21680 [Bryobacteraceae bacterium]|nr:hypothetical protein [Bryobacteraceae bacterium]